MAMVYEFKAGAHVPAGADANAVGRRLAAIARSKGGLTTEAVTDAAEANPGDPVFGPWFEWDDELSVRKYHELQASAMIRSVTVVHVEKSEGSKALVTRAFVRIDDAYEPISIAIASPDKRRILLDEVKRDKTALEAKLNELLAVIELI